MLLMKSIKNITKLLGIILISLSITQCACTMTLEKQSPIEFTDIYYTNWVSGVKSGGFGTNLFIEVKGSTIKLDSVFYKGKSVKLETKPINRNKYIGRFRLEEKETLSDAVKNNKSAFPFQLKEDQCVVSYLVNGKTKYYKLNNIKERKDQTLPMATPINKN